MYENTAKPQIIVLDDDPTGSQTVHSCPLLTRWERTTLLRGLDDPSRVMFILTNTRSVSTTEADEVTRAVCRNLKGLLAESARPWIVVSRSDSTLRGHYTAETDVIAAELGPFDAHFLIPQFFEGGRITAATVRLFDPKQSDEEIRTELRALSGNACCVVSAERREELDRFARLLLEATADGKRFLFRSGASLLTALASQPRQPTPPELMCRYVPHRRAGIIIVGSHVSLSTRQLNHLLAHTDAERLVPLEVDVSRLPDAGDRLKAKLSRSVARAHRKDRDVEVFTTRSERLFSSVGERLDFGRAISRLLTGVLHDVPRTLGFVLSKGGITSHDVLSQGLGLDMARSVGQIQPGSSVAVTEPEHRFGAIPVVIFPGNVGGDDAMTVVYERLRGDS